MVNVKAITKIDWVLSDVGDEEKVSTLSWSNTNFFVIDVQTQ
jgi:hypothetical protein